MKVFGTDLALLEAKGRAIKAVIEKVPGIKHVTLVQELGQPSLTVTVDRAKMARYGLSVRRDVNGLIEAAVGGAAATQVVQGERTFDLVVRLQPQYRADAGADRQHPRSRRRTGSRSRCAKSPTSQSANGAAFIYRQDNSRYIGVQYSVEGRDLASAVAEAQRRGREAGDAADRATRSRWGGEFEEYTASRAQMNIVLPITIVLIFAHPVRALPQLQVPAHHRRRRASSRRRSADCSRC